MDASDILAAAGFRVREAGIDDGASALLETDGASVILGSSDVEMPGDTNGSALAGCVDQHWQAVEIVIASGRIAPAPGDMPDKATFIAKPYNARMIHDHLRRTLPDGKKPEPLRQAV